MLLRPFTPRTLDMPSARKGNLGLPAKGVMGQQKTQDGGLELSSVLVFYCSPHLSVGSAHQFPCGMWCQWRQGIDCLGFYLLPTCCETLGKSLYRSLSLLTHWNIGTKIRHLLESEARIQRSSWIKEPMNERTNVSLSPCHSEPYVLLLSSDEDTTWVPGRWPYHIFLEDGIFPLIAFTSPSLFSGQLGLLVFISTLFPSFNSCTDSCLG